MPKKQEDYQTCIDKTAFGQQVRAARMAEHLQISDLAEALDVSEIFLRHIELGRRLPSLTIFLTLCNVLHIAPSYFLVKDLDLDLKDPVQMAIDMISGCTPRQSAMIIEMLGAARKHIKD